MARGQSTLLDPLRRLIGRQSGSALTDAELLERYVTQRDAAAFEVLVWRHGPMVLALCRRVLRDDHEAEDAFQATFLVFARKAGSVGRGAAVGSWLYKVAFRVALRLRDRAANRPASVAEPPHEPLAPAQPDDLAWRELRPVLDAEIAGLPEKYRAPFILCYLQGRTNEEAAAQLGCPKGTVLSRLARGREWLRERLTRRGLTPAAVALALNLPGEASAALPAALAQSTTGAAVPFGTGTAAGVVSLHIATLAEGVMRTMLATKVKATVAALIALALLGTGIGWAVSGERYVPVVATFPAPASVPAEDGGGQEPVGEEPALPALTGVVSTPSKDGDVFHVNVPPAKRGGEPGRFYVRIGPKTVVVYNGVVGPDGATLTENHQVQVWFPKGAKEGLATKVIFTGPEAGRRGDLTGIVTDVGKDGKSITIDATPPLDRGEVDRIILTIPFDEKTVLSFSNVGRGEAKLAIGMTARVWGADDGKTAGMVHVVGTTEPGRPDDPEPTHVGKVVRTADGKAFALELRPTVRGEEPQRVSIKIAERTVLSFTNVGLDEAKIAVGLQARVWLAEGSVDTAARVAFAGTVPERWTTLAGKVVAVSKDGKTLTVEQPAPNRGEEPIRTEIKITDKSRLTYFGVGTGEAKPAEGLEARIRLLDGSKDTAGRITFYKPVPGRGR